jgi:nucleoside-diphosphate-sugar epimerase
VKANEGECPLTPKDWRILVTGGAGFIGSHVVDKLIKADAEVTVLDNLDTGKMENLAQHEQNRDFHFVKGDIRNFETVKPLVKSVDSVVNLAAIASVQRSVENPLLVNDVNVKGTLNLLKASLDSDVKRFVQASSAAVYGDAQTLPVQEDFNLMPLSPYAVSKIAAENYAVVFNEVYGLETVGLRFFNVYGPRQANNPYSGAITIFVNELLADRQPRIFGDGEQTRDFVFVEDVVSVTLLALTEKAAVGEIFNVASGKAISINGIVQILQKTTGREDIEPVHEGPREGDIRHSYASIEKAKTRLGYEPTFSLQKGLKELVGHMVKSG